MPVMKRTIAAVVSGWMMGAAVWGQQAPAPAPTPDKTIPPTAPGAPATPPALPKPSAEFGMKPDPNFKSRVVEGLTAEAGKLRPLVKTEAVKALLDAVPALPEPSPRLLFRSKDRRSALSASEYDAMTEEERAKYQPYPRPPMFYYYTGYGSPLIYVRPLDLIAERAGWGGADGFKGKKILDFGYGLIGHLRLLAMRGADVTGIEVSPVLRALYSEPGDTGEIKGVEGSGVQGTLRLLHGFWPGEARVKEAAGEGYDLFISKNVLKRGYIHPPKDREVDERQLIKLGVDDATFLKEMHRLLKPGGYALIYNISPAQNPKDGEKPYLPHADGEFPFGRAAAEQAGFEVIAFDQPDHEAVLDVWMALGINGELSREEQAKDLFAMWTLLRKK